jgi:DNA polymerase-3 subunit epsilon
MNRQIALDTETTGLDPVKGGHRIVEIGCVEMINRVRTGRVFHTYLDPSREMPDEAFRIHGLSTNFLKGKAKFADVAVDFLAFLDDSPLVIHNAAFDLKFLDFELGMIGFPALGPGREVIDTLMVARQKFPGAPASLDALCKRFNIDLSTRTKHGALLDAELLADMYLELMGGAQSSLEFAQKILAGANAQEKTAYKEPRLHEASAEEMASHTEFLKKLKTPLWLELSSSS